MTVPAKAASIRFSLRTSDPSEIKIRYAEALAHLEGILYTRESRPLKLTRAQAARLLRRFLPELGQPTPKPKDPCTIVVGSSTRERRLSRSMNWTRGSSQGSWGGVQRRNLKDKGEASEIERTRVCSSTAC